MKKIAIVVLALGLLAPASACATTKLTTAETCERVNLVVSSPSGNAGKVGMTRFANAIRPIEAVSSEELQPSLRAILDYADETLKEHPDSARLAQLKPGFENASSTYSQLCGG